MSYSSPTYLLNVESSSSWFVVCERLKTCKQTEKRRLYVCVRVSRPGRNGGWGGETLHGTGTASFINLKSNTIKSSHGCVPIESITCVLL